LRVEEVLGGQRGRLREIGALVRDQGLVTQVLLPDREAAQRDERNNGQSDDPQDFRALRHEPLSRFPLGNNHTFPDAPAVVPATRFGVPFPACTTTISPSSNAALWPGSSRSSPRRNGMPPSIACTRLTTACARPAAR